MDDSGAALSIARSITERLGEARAVMAVVLACAVLTYGGISLFVVAFAVFPVADALFRQAGVPHRLIPPSIALGGLHLHDDGSAGTPAIQNAIPMRYFGTTLFAAPGHGILASPDHRGLRPVVAAHDRGARPPRRRGLWLCNTGNGRYTVRARACHERRQLLTLLNCRTVIEASGCRPLRGPLAPIGIVLAVNLIMSVCAAADGYRVSRRAAVRRNRPRRGKRSLVRRDGAGGGLSGSRAAAPQASAGVAPPLDARGKRPLLPVLNTASLVGFGAVVAALPAFAVVRDGFLAVPGGPLMSVAVAADAIGGITVLLGRIDHRAERAGRDLRPTRGGRGHRPALMHRVAAISSGALAMVPHNGAVVTLCDLRRHPTWELSRNHDGGTGGAPECAHCLSRWGGWSGHSDAVRPTTGVSGADFRAGSGGALTKWASGGIVGLLGNGAPCR